MPTLGSVNKVLFIMIAWGMINLEIDNDDFDVILSLTKISELNTSLLIMDEIHCESVL